MPLKVAAFYQFARLPDYRELREPLRASCAGRELKGSILLAQEGKFDEAVALTVNGALP